VNTHRVLTHSSLVLLLALGARYATGCSSDEPGAAPDVGDSGSGDETGSAPDAGGPAEDAADSAVIPDGGPACNDGGWCRMPVPGIPAPNLKAVHSISPTRALAAGETCLIQGSQYLCNSSLLLWDGTEWTTVARGLPRITAIWASDADHFWIVDESDRSLYRVTFTGDKPTLTVDHLPYDLSTCADVKLAISGSSEANIYVAAYCYGSDQTTRGLLFHRAPADGGSEPVWSTVWNAGGDSTFQAALGAVYVDPSGQAFAAGWKIHASSGTYGARYLIPDVMNTLVLRINGSAVQEEELAPSLAMCPQSIWAGGGTVFVSGVCDGGYTDFTKYPTLVRSAPVDGGPGWLPVFQTAVGQYGAVGSSFPILWGFAKDDVYAAGSWAQHWDGSSLQTVSLAVNGAPVASRVTSAHGSSPSDVWMVGSGFAMHRTK
jgi:hypothetical protein